MESPSGDDSLNDDESGLDMSDDVEPDEEDLSEYRNESEDEAILKAVTDIIDRLYKLAIMIRDPKTRLATSKAVTFKKVDEDTGINLIDEFVEVDKRHVEELFWDHRVVDLTEDECIPEKFEDHERRPRNFLEANRVLISRLAAANTRRRQQFGYWRHHHFKNTLETARVLEHHLNILPELRGSVRVLDPQLNILPELGGSVMATTLKSVSRPSSATYLDNPGRINIDDSASTISVRTFIPDAQNVQDEQVHVPEPPECLKGAKYFLCPYCFTLCSQSLLKKEAWR